MRVTNHSLQEYVQNIMTDCLNKNSLNLAFFLFTTLCHAGSTVWLTSAEG